MNISVLIIRSALKNELFGVPYNNAYKDDGALDAHWGAMKTYDYFFEVLNRKSFDNKGTAIYNNVHWWSGDNAFWGQNYLGEHGMYYLDGTNCDIFTSLDIVAHEFGHGVCEFSSNLVYQGESGAINESLSDIWAACVQNYANVGKQIWIIGDEIGCIMRNMANPKAYNDPDTYQGTNWGDPNSSYDEGYVHTNSGVMNHWFYILTVGKTGTNDLGNSYIVAGIGIDKAAKIVYRAETIKMTKNTKYPQARTAMINAAIDLFGEDCDEVKSVTNAWYAVGVGAPYDCTKYITNKNYTTGIHNINGCKIVISNTNVQNKATVNFKAEESVSVNSTFHAVAGSKVHISIGTIPPCVPPTTFNNMLTTNDEKPYYLMRTEDILANNFFKPNFKLSPNPNTGAFKIETNFPVTEVARLKITNTLGVSVYETQTLSSQEIQLPNASAGLYFVVVLLNDGTVLNQKMMIQK